MQIAGEGEVGERLVGPAERDIGAGAPIAGLRIPGPADRGGLEQGERIGRSAAGQACRAGGEQFVNLVAEDGNGEVGRRGGGQARRTFFWRTVWSGPSIASTLAGVL